MLGCSKTFKSDANSKAFAHIGCVTRNEKSRRKHSEHFAVFLLRIDKSHLILLYMAETKIH